MILQDFTHCLAYIKCSLNGSHHHYVTKQPTKPKFGKDSFVHYYCKTYGSQVNSPFLYAWPWSRSTCVYLPQRVGSHPLQDSLVQSWQARKSQTHLCSFLHCYWLIKSSECLSHECQMSICLGLSWILLPHPVHNPHRAHDVSVLVWQHTRIPWVSDSAPTVDPLTSLQA